MNRQARFLLLLAFCVGSVAPVLSAQDAADSEATLSRADGMATEDRKTREIMNSFARMVAEFEAAAESSGPQGTAIVAPTDRPDDQPSSLAIEKANVIMDQSPYPDTLQKALFFQEQGEYALAVKAYLDVVNNLDASPEDRKRALLGLAGAYFARGSMARAVNLLELYLQYFPEDERRPDIFYQLGLLYRELGLHEDSRSVFYRVLNAIVVIGESDLPRFLSMARRAQFEIARSHFDLQEWDQALALFERIKLFELNSTDRETLLYYKAIATLRNEQLSDGLHLLNNFILDYSDSPLIPEMHFTRAEALFLMDREEAAIEALMQLMDQAGVPTGKVGDKWVFWRQKAGNRFANRYYENRDYLAALRIYQGMVSLNPSKDWQLPLIYQIGLCFEKLSMFDRATESYAFVVQSLNEAGQINQRPQHLQQLSRNASWRTDMLKWRSDLDQNFSLPQN